MSEQFELGGIVADLRSAEVAKHAAERTEAKQRHRDSMVSCWPEWDGNDEIKVGTRIEVGSVCVPLETPVAVAGFMGDDHEDGPRSQMYAYCAPCYIAEVISPDEFIAVIDYPERVKDTVPYCWDHNGIRLRLSILDVWPPCGILIEARRQEEAA